MTTTAIACKLPNGLVLEHMDQKVTLKGANDDNAVNGFGVTEGVDADWFKAWANNEGKLFPALANGSIFAVDKDVKGATRDAAQNPEAMTGQEPISAMNPGAGIEPTPETVKEIEKNADTAGKGK